MRRMILLLVCFAIVGCATPYQKSGFWGDGYKEQQLQADEFQISFAGNSGLSQAMARQYALRRAAELLNFH